MNTDEKWVVKLLSYLLSLVYEEMVNDLFHLWVVEWGIKSC